MPQKGQFHWEVLDDLPISIKENLDVHCNSATNLASSETGYRKTIYNGRIRWNLVYRSLKFGDKLMVLRCAASCVARPCAECTSKLIHQTIIPVGCLTGIPMLVFPPSPSAEEGWISKLQPWKIPVGLSPISYLLVYIIYNIYIYVSCLACIIGGFISSLESPLASVHYT